MRAKFARIFLFL